MQNENAETLLDALNAGLPSADEPEVETPEGEEVETPEGEEEVETPEGEEVETPEGEEEAEGEEGEEDPEAAAAAKAKKPAKEPDPINDPLPKGTLQGTTERFKLVVDKLKEQTTRADTVQSHYDELLGEINGAGMDGN